ncbi:MAG: hypothetical protein WBR15_00690 [Gammaproteobacteria bacterium]
MYKQRMSFLPGLVGVLILSFTLYQPAMAVNGQSPGQSIRGLVQNIDYLHHAITVNGQTYAVSPYANFYGIASFTILHVGMPIQYTLSNVNNSGGPDGPPGGLPVVAPPGQAPGTAHGGPAQTNNGAPMIISITWLPGGV